ncbi:hypothetical protein HNR46_002026 [Haloferula luteola]|uniref:DUF4157 domain-containing protein n=1 Tax=Haloferula luteola TaxID=595692 RepID=A0A840V095_9BACT|nr:hypothetical protein [Haloferula luteola]MBB5351787.1 hypothetical protein [Haloferula luteola]
MLLASLAAVLMAPLAACWSRFREHQLLKVGSPLPPEALTFARQLGIHAPENLRVQFVHEVPLPLPSAMAHAFSRLGFPILSAAGMSLGRGICAVSPDSRLLRHELVHTLQYQRLGGHLPFMRRYLRECIHHGYATAPMEIEARDRAQEEDRIPDGISPQSG